MNPLPGKTQHFTQYTHTKREFCADIKHNFRYFLAHLRSQEPWGIFFLFFFFFQSTQLFIKLMAARFIGGIGASKGGVQNDKQYLCLFSALTLNYQMFCMHFKNMLMASGENRRMHHWNGGWGGEYHAWHPRKVTAGKQGSFLKPSTWPKVGVE